MGLSSKTAGFTARLSAQWKAFRPGFIHCAALIFIALFAAYGGSLKNGFVDFDDSENIFASGGLMSPDPGAYFRDYWEVHPVKAVKNLLVQRPLRDLTLFIDKRLYGADPWGFHLSNLLYQYAASLGAFLAASLLLGSRGAGLLAALLFTLHPAQTEAVAYLGGRRDILSGGFCLYSLWFAALALEKRRKVFFLAAAAAWALALLSKQAAVALPLAALPLLWLRYPEALAELARSGGWKFKGAVAAAAAAVLAYAGLNAHAQLTQLGNLDPAQALFGGSLGAQLLSVPAVFALALYKALLPLKLVGDYSFAAIPPVMSPADWRLWASLGALSALAWGLARRSRACPAAAAGALFFLLAYAPMLPLLPMPHNLEVFAEHWLYLPLFGLALAATAALGRLRALGAAPYAAAAGALLLFYGARTALRVPDWRSPEVFWEKTAEDSPRCARALANLGSLRADCGDTARAEELYKMALQIRPGYTAPLLNLAQLRLAAGDKAGAQTYIDEASAASGAMVNARNINFSRGLVALARGDGRQAQVFFGEALMHRPVFHYAPAAHGYAVARLLQGDEAGAEKYFRQALRLQPDHYASAQDLGKLHYGRGNYGEAAGLFERAAALNPFSAEPLSYLAACRSFLGDYKGALESAAKALYLEPRRAEPRLAAAQAYRQAGRFRAALGYARRGLALEKDSPRLLLEQGVNLRELGDVPGALESFERSLTLDPRRAETFLHYADALLAAGYREGARRAAAKALQLRPGYEDAALALKKLSGQGSGSARP